MTTLMIIIFVVGYLAIALEHPLNLNKTAPAMLAAVFCWTVYALYSPDSHEVTHHLREHLGEVSEILFFLMGAMTIVELIDAHHGFRFVTDRIKAKNKVSLLWILSFVTFFLSAILDNLTTSIVMVSLLRKLVHNDTERKFFAGMVIIAANAGGAWSPIGDVTTTMLWIEERITTLAIIKMTFIPSVVCTVVPLIFASMSLKGKIEEPKNTHSEESHQGGLIMLLVGVGGLIFVPAFKTITHLPPYVGILLALGVLWTVSEIIDSKADELVKKKLSPIAALSRIDTASILFFLGILLAIGSLQVTGVLTNLAQWLDDNIGHQDMIVMAIGAASAIVDNVPLVAAAIGMYSPEVYPTDHKLWEFMAYCAGTGGSMLIIGSAAGVAVMGMEKIEFMWYMRKLGWLAAVGYFAGAGTYLLMYMLAH
ncbi:sodium:proton antiporter NhaD [Thermoflexibacter ruber]|uniref:Na+/H+ antiporter NhaD n=1 Tax=Thermoflexibacter ruber TaxID=1003 RepID=A0A1I2K6I3_9BACT|nr:sodium:proton antiporter NhaD [Thermoflexibacter ruber]SFF60681.1 Na+/H+ antiporter NhaD [Thermoflexibacter ruber]